MDLFDILDTITGGRLNSFNNPLINDKPIGGGNLFSLIKSTEKIRNKVENKLKENGEETAGKILEKINNGLKTIQNPINALKPETIADTFLNGKKSRDAEHTFNIGDHIYILKLGYTHHGIYCGKGMVIHYDRGSVRKESLEIFSDNAKINIIHDQASYSGSEIIRRAESRLGESDYNLMFNNCEHFANWCRNGACA